jgi:hypothetical protein
VERLWHWIREIPLTAVAVNADHMHFPDNWLFRYRWGKGKKQIKRAANAKAKVESEDEEEDVKPNGKSFLALVSLLIYVASLLTISLMAHPPPSLSSKSVDGRQLWSMRYKKCRKVLRSNPRSRKVLERRKARPKLRLQRQVYVSQIPYPDRQESDASESSVDLSEDEKPKKRAVKTKAAKAVKTQVKEEEQSPVKEAKVNCSNSGKCTVSDL